MSIKETPWDAATLGIPTYEITDFSEEDLDIAGRTRGHYTIRVDPLSDKRMLHAYGFYYCDTLIEPYCSSDRFRFFERKDIHVSPKASFRELLGICHGAFSHGRFHKDFNLDRNLADKRYDKWLESLEREGKTMGLYHDATLAGFIAYSGNCLVLHAIGDQYRGRGLGKYFWSAACRDIFSQGAMEITSSISASNLAVVNLYASLGFRFRKTVDVYHLYIK